MYEHTERTYEFDITAPGARLLTTSEAAEILHLRPSTLIQYRVSGGGPEYFKLGRAVRYSIEHIQAWADARRRSHSSQ